ncbi:unnamed protein product [Commensalibacter communis]|uniref:Uncharacterized protein n=1 Tax=Commensalibacter communis TaxID=2972786 RepID=A0A9W4TRE6_9PROT|nr:hypothetical protein [Commensalibacter communis]CAI3958064.1 unnamed protein product [Commensalibacter communis]CAI3960094.1 unnamed protein product [Commensalibacter communis]
MSEYGNAIQSGLDVMRLDQKLDISYYQKTILPYDGFVFWVKMRKKTSIDAMIHYTDELKHEDQSFYNDANLIITTKEYLFDFFQNDLEILPVFDYEGKQYAIRRSGQNTQHATIFHNFARIIEPQFQSLFLNNKKDFTRKTVQFSNSISRFILLANGYFDLVKIPYEIYPEWLVPFNKKPPYITIGISETEALNVGHKRTMVEGKETFINPAKDHIELNLYGLDNHEAINFLATLEKWSLIYQQIGFLNIPRVTDLHNTQNEIGSLSQKKVIEIEVFYYQSANIDEALLDRMIDEVLINMNDNDREKDVLRCKR